MSTIRSPRLEYLLFGLSGVLGAVALFVLLSAFMVLMVYAGADAELVSATYVVLGGVAVLLTAGSLFVSLAR